jgi:DNA-binding NarL/FixJ family response regulator
MSDVVILEDHKMFSVIFSSYLQQTGQFSSVTSFDTVPDFLSFISSYQSDNMVVILDYFLPDTDIETVIDLVRGRLRSSKIIVLTGLTSSILLKGLLSSNLAGIISKVDSPVEVINCLNTCKKGKTYLSVTIRDILANSNQNPARLELTNKETQILKLLAQGKTVETVSQELNLSKHTVITHRRNILAKSDFHSIAELIVFLVKNGMI